MRERAYGSESDCLRIRSERRCVHIQPVDRGRGVPVRRCGVRRLALEGRNSLDEQTRPLGRSFGFDGWLRGSGLSRLRGWRVGRSFNCENRLLGWGARSRRRSICLPDGPCILRNCVGLRLFANLFLLLLILRQDRNEIVRDRLFELLLKVRLIWYPGQKGDEEGPTLNV
jgi:hypothetical protein